MWGKLEVYTHVYFRLRGQTIGDKLNGNYWSRWEDNIKLENHAVGWSNGLDRLRSSTLKKEGECSSKKLITTKGHSVTTHTSDLQCHRLQGLPTHSAISSTDEWLSTVTSIVNWLTRRLTGQQQELCDAILNNTLTVAQLHKKFPAFYTTWHLDKSDHPYPKPDVSNSHTHDTSITHIFMLPSK